jgi:hypothetical protein
LRLNAILWQTDLPEWDEKDWFALFLRHREAAAGVAPPVTPAERHRYALRLMHVVTLQFTANGWMDSLPPERLDPRDVAQELVAHLSRKTNVFAVPNRPDLSPAADGSNKPKKKCRPGDEWRMTLKQFNTAVKMRCYTLIEERRNKSWEVALTDCAKRGDAEHAGSSSLKPIEAVARQHTPAVRLGAFLRAAEARICDPVYGRNADALLLLYRYLCWRLVRAGEWVSWAELPQKLRDRVEPYQHLDLTTAIRSAVARAMGNLAYN